MRGHVSTPFTLPHGVLVTVLRSATDRHGDPVGDEADHTINGCGVDWNATTSNREFQDVQITDVDLYVPRAADVVASDKVEIGARTFHVLGKADVGPGASDDRHRLRLQAGTTAGGVWCVM